MSNALENGFALNLGVLSNKIENQDNKIIKLDERLESLAQKQDEISQEASAINNTLKNNTLAVNKLEQQLKEHTETDKSIQSEIHKFTIRQTATENSLNTLIKVLSKISIVLLGGIVTMIVGIMMRFGS